MGMTSTFSPEAPAGTVHVRLAGDITEESSFEPILRSDAPVVVLDLAEVRRINSAGVREWVNFVAELARRERKVTLERCSVAVVQQLNMVVNFRGNADVRSVFVPYCCGACGAERSELLEVVGPGAPDVASSIACACGGTMEFDDLPETYLSFLG